MILSLAVILLTLLIAYLWSTRGFFSSLIHMICTIIAGAIAFAAWEPIGYALLGAAPRGGALSAVEGSAWAIALIVPFALSLAILRTIADSILRANVIVTRLADYAGGGFCGLVSSVITVGILTLGVGFMRLSSEFMGYQPVQYQGNGSPTRQQKLLFPVNSITAGLYAGLSEKAFSSPEPLARWHPRFAELGPTMRMNYGDGVSRNTMRPDDFSIVGRFSVGSQTSKFADLLKDNLGSAQQVVDIEGNAFDPGTKLEGIIIRFAAGATEKNSGKMTVGPAQFAMLLETQDALSTRIVYPVSVSSQAEADKPIAGRWRFDSPGVYIASVGGASESYFAFEFPIPPNHRPIALYAKGVRVPIDESIKSVANFTSGSSRDAAMANLAALATGGSLSAVSSGPMDASKATVLRVAENRLPDQLTIGQAIGFNIQKGLHDPLEIRDEGKNKIFVVNGEKSFENKAVQEMQIVEQTLRVDKFVEDTDTVLVKVQVAGFPESNPFSLLNPMVQNLDNRAVPVALVDSNGQSYAPVGFVLKDLVFTKLRFTPGEPLVTLDALDNAAKRLTRSSPDDQLQLIFRVSKGVSVQYFGVGSQALVEIKPPVPMK
jgi:hypothetical protein